MTTKRFALLLLATAFAFQAVAAEKIPERPEQLVFPKLEFTPPDPAPMRHVLENGIVVYTYQNNELPLVTVNVLFKGGRYLDPKGKEGLAQFTSMAWVQGGAGDMTAQQLDEELEFLAASLDTHIGGTHGSVRLDLLSKDLERGLDILMDVLLRPRFQQDRFEKVREDIIQQLKERNDHTASIENREWNRLIYGDDYWLNRLPTKASVDAITPEDCKQLVSKLLRRGNVVLAVSGDFDADKLLALLNEKFSALPAMEEPLPGVPQPTWKPEPGIYVVNKEDVNQGRVSIGHIGLKKGHPDEFKLSVMNHILGGGGFTSMITREVRSNAGLAYHAGSYIGFHYLYPGAFRALFQSKSATVPAAIRMTLDQIKKIRKEKVSKEQLDVAKGSLVGSYPSYFESPEVVTRLYANDELLGFPHSYWLTYREKVDSVTIDDVLEAAQKHLKPDQMVILVVGNIAEIEKGSPDYPDKLKDFGKIHHIPLRDPLTLEPITE